MSFSAEVRDELSRHEPECEYCDISTLAAVARICGTLNYSGPGHYRLQVATETGAVARTCIGLTHKILKLETEFSVRKSVLHRTRNYLIVLPDQPDLEKALVLLGILDSKGSLVTGIPHHLTDRECCRKSYVRSALVAGGFVADPKGDFHLEIAVQGEQYANELADLVCSLGVRARVNPRRGSYAVYMKSADDICTLLSILGADSAVASIQDARAMKSVKNDVNRLVNAEIANQGRSATASQRQLELIRRAGELGLRGTMSPAIEEFCDLREAHPELTLRDLGELADPPLSKSALYHRSLRLEKLVEEAEGGERREADEA